MEKNRHDHNKLCTCGGEGLIVSLGQHCVIRRSSCVGLQHWIGKEMVPQSSCREKEGDQ